MSNNKRGFPLNLEVGDSRCCLALPNVWISYVYFTTYIYRMHSNENEYTYL